MQKETNTISKLSASILSSAGAGPVRVLMTRMDCRPAIPAPPNFKFYACAELPATLKLRIIKDRSAACRRQRLSLLRNG